MKLDNETQREILIGLIRGSTIPGHSIEDAYNLLTSISNAEIESDILGSENLQE